MEQKRILGVGSALVDVLAQVSDGFIAANLHGQKGGMEMVEPDWQDRIIAGLPEKPVFAPGGAAGNTIFGLASLGFPVAMLSKIGDDDAGRFYAKRLEKKGGSAEEFLVTKRAATGRCISFVTPDSERTMRSYLGASQLVTAEEAAAVDYSKYRLVYVEGYMLFLPGVVEAVVESAKRAGCEVAMDLASFEVVRIFRDRILGLLERYVDLVFSNEDEGAALFEDCSEEEIADELAKRCRVAALKLGSRGALVQSGGVREVIAPQLVKALDTTGAGDLWAAGFLGKYLNGAELAECGRGGALVSREVVQVMGAEIPDSGWARVREAWR